MNAKPVFHGSDIEKICEYYHLKKEEIVNFAANVNPLGLSEEVKSGIAARLDLLSSYPDREYTSLRETISKYCGVPAGKRLQRTDLTADRDPEPKADAYPRPHILRVFQRALLLREHAGILSP